MRIFSLGLFTFLVSCVLGISLNVRADSFPDAWWQPIPQAELASWEIPPQAADRAKGEVILSKKTELGIFSNLAATSFNYEGQVYASIEGLWQGMKYPDGPNDERLKDKSVVWPFTRAQVFAMSGFDAKHAGDAANANMKMIGIKWITYQGQKVEYNGSGVERHYEIILGASREKAKQNLNVKKLLLATGDLKFLPDHAQQPNANPAYKYFDIFMKIRDELRQAPGTP